MSVLRQPRYETERISQDGNHGHTQTCSLHEVQEAIHCEEEMSHEIERLNQ